MFPKHLQDSLCAGEFWQLCSGDVVFDVDADSFGGQLSKPNVLDGLLHGTDHSGVVMLLGLLDLQRHDGVFLGEVP